LGLAVVKKIADEHGARVDIANRIVDGAVAGAQVSLSLAVARSART
jgi:nitrogen fixation/metabolism regulation signal transduction histidine kinase